MSAEARLQAMKIELPNGKMRNPLLIPAVHTGRLVFCSGHVSRNFDKSVEIRGKLGRDLALSQGQEGARLAMLNCLAALKGAVEDLDRVARVVKVLGFVNSAEDFQDHPAVIDGASQVLQDVFGDTVGRHPRTAIGVAALPYGYAVEIEAVFEVEST